jgi:hypothetical protein
MAVAADVPAMQNEASRNMHDLFSLNLHMFGSSVLYE